LLTMPLRFSWIPSRASYLHHAQARCDQMLACRIMKLRRNSPMKLFLQRDQLRIQLGRPLHACGGVSTISTGQRALKGHDTLTFFSPAFKQTLVGGASDKFPIN
jgi:hypothetical protein